MHKGASEALLHNSAYYGVIRHKGITALALNRLYGVFSKDDAVLCFDTQYACMLLI